VCKLIDSGDFRKKLREMQTTAETLNNHSKSKTIGSIITLLDMQRVVCDISPSEICDTAKALEEVRAYRELGTVEELKAIKNSTQLILDILNEYSNVGTIEEFKALKEKSEPKKLKHDVCPNCSTNNDMIIKHLGNPQAHKIVYCWNCGQKLNWE